jgi:dipeptidyl aminopeptidase/acylaminoacyl peptidase
LFDLATRKERHHLTRPNFVRELALSADGSLLALGAQEGPASIWDVKTGKMVHELRGDSFVGGVAFSPDGKTLASTNSGAKGDRNAIRLWDVATGNQLRCLNKDSEPVWNVIFSADGKMLITASGSSIRLRDLATGEEQGPAAGNPWYLGNVILSPDGRTLAYHADDSIRALGPGRGAGGRQASGFPLVLGLLGGRQDAGRRYRPQQSQPLGGGRSPPGPPIRDRSEKRRLRLGRLLSCGILLRRQTAGLGRPSPVARRP